ncbi:hypothetical protein [Pseudonocardia sp. H11422]|uniref:sunset domain-containing protein n=1 Tax=Pseudonocardia sp. H11422 TaxID=2835866 RepID=UPI001BDC21EA|nr:hypothetical protein [Pseudonocardia sp. H11422]
MSGQIWLWVLVVIIVLAAVAVLLVRRRSTGGVPTGSPDSGEAPTGGGGAGDFPTPEPAAATPARTEPAESPVQASAPVVEEPADTSAHDPEPAGTNGNAPEPPGATGDAPEPTDTGGSDLEVVSATDSDPQPADTTANDTDRRARAVDSALAVLDAGLIGRTGPNRTAGTAADAVSSVVAEARKGPHPGSALPDPDGYAPSPEFTIKANNGSQRFHDPDSPYYVRTRADLWFRTAEDAERAGYRPWNGRSTTT